MLQRVRESWTIENVMFLGEIGIDNDYSVRHSAGKYVKQQASIDGVESFWVVLKHGTFHHFSVKYLNRYVDEFSTGIIRLHGL